MIEDNILSPEVQELLQAAAVEVSYSPDSEGAYGWVGPGRRSGAADTRFAAAQEALRQLRLLAEAHPLAPRSEAPPQAVKMGGKPLRKRAS